MMKKLSMSLLLAVCVSMASFGQLEKKMQDEGVVKGVIYKNGAAMEGYIRKMGTTSWDNKTYTAMWEFQGPIKFIPKDVFENNEKIKNKMYESYEGKDCEGYKYDSLYYESVKFADMSAVGMNMLPQKMFMYRESANKISLYHYYQSPPPVGVYQAGEYEKLMEDCSITRHVYRIGKGGKLKLVNDLNIEKELADCPTVVEKQSKGEYKVIGKEGKTSGLNKLINNSSFREEVRLMAIEDYNNVCK